MKKLLVLLIVLSFASFSFGDTYNAAKWATISLGTFETIQTRYSLTHYNVVEKNHQMRWLMSNDFRAYSFALAEGLAQHYCFNWLKKKNKAFGYMVMGMFFIARGYCVIRNANALAHASSR